MFLPIFIKPTENPPIGYVFVVDSIGNRLVGPNGYFLVAPAGV